MYFWQSILAIWSVSGDMVGLFWTNMMFLIQFSSFWLFSGGKHGFVYPSRSHDMNTRLWFVLDRFLSINVLLAINTCYLVSFRGYGRLILRKYDVFDSIQFILIVFWGKAWLCLPLKVTWHEYSIVIRSEFCALLPDDSKLAFLTAISLSFLSFIKSTVNYKSGGNDT